VPGLSALRNSLVSSSKLVRAFLLLSGQFWLPSPLLFIITYPATVTMKPDAERIIPAMKPCDSVSSGSCQRMRFDTNAHVAINNSFSSVFTFSPNRKTAVSEGCLDAGLGFKAHVPKSLRRAANSVAAYPLFFLNKREKGGA